MSATGDTPEGDRPEGGGEAGPAGPGEYLRLVALSAAIGLPAALVAALFLALSHELEHWLWDDLPDALGRSSPPWYLVVGLPVAGALVVVIARRFLPGDGGHTPLHGLSMAPTPLANAAGVALAALGTLGFGAVLGPEAPVIALGSVVGMVATRVVTLDQRSTAVMATAGSFAAVSALFGGPLVAGIVLVEFGSAVGTITIAALLPGFVAAAVGYLVFLGFGDWGGLDAPGLLVPDLQPYQGTHLDDLALAVAVGFVVAVLAAGVRRLAAAVDGLGGRLGMPGLLLAGGLAVGLVAQIGHLLGADPQDVLFSGQSSVPVVVAEDSVKIVVVLVVAKAVGYAVSLGCGFRGGPVFPAMFLGVGLASLGVVWFDVSPTFAIAVGAAAGMAAQTRLVVSSLLFAALLVGTAGTETISGAVLAVVAAWLTTAALERRRRESDGRWISARAPGRTPPA
jgi:H+/Cl- antiporter ClcA